MGITKYIYIAVILVFLGLSWEVKHEAGKIDTLNVEIGALQTSNKQYVVNNVQLQGSIATCNKSIDDLKKAGEEVDTKIAQEQQKAMILSKKYSQKAQVIINRPAMGDTDCIRGKDEIANYLENKDVK